MLLGERICTKAIQDNPYQEGTIENYLEVLYVYLILTMLSIIETILRCDDLNKYDWYHLVDLESGLLKGSVHETITARCGDEIERLFVRVINMRNRIIHSYQITNKAGEQALATKDPIRNGNRQFEITEEYLVEFIKLNEQLCDKLHTLRGY